jgi:chorismate mutase / prephenate dehydratase
MTSQPLNLDELRRRIDGVDDRIHDLIMERAEIVETIAALKRDTGMPALRPGREAKIVRRILGRHRGHFPRQSLLRIWRELLGGTTAMQGRFAVAVRVNESGAGPWDLARDHYGTYIPMLALRGAGEVLSAVAEERAMVGVLPMPDETERAPWWPQLVGAGAHALCVIARLPFGGAGNARDGDGDALVIGRGEAEATGADRSLIVVETEGEVSRARLSAAFEAAGQKVTFFAQHVPSPGMVWNLIELDDLVKPGDSSLDAALKPLGDRVRDVRLLGAYAQPLPREAK